MGTRSPPGGPSSLRPNRNALAFLPSYRFVERRRAGCLPAVYRALVRRYQEGDRQQSSAMPHLVHHKRLRIEWGHCDPAGIVFNSRFFEYFDWSTWEMFESVLGVPRQDLFTTYDIIGVPLVDAQARFHVPVKFGDFVDVASEIDEFRRSSFDVTHRMTLAGELAVEGRETRVWAGRDAEGRIRGKPIPDEVIGRFRIA